MAEVNLLRSLPHTKRDVQKRATGKDETVVAVAKQFGEMYWDGPRQYGYGKVRVQRQRFRKEDQQDRECRYNCEAGGGIPADSEAAAQNVQRD